MATQPTLSIAVGDTIQLSVRRQATPQVVSAVSAASINSEGANQYAVTTSVGVFNVTPNSTVLSGINSAGVGVWVVGR